MRTTLTIDDELIVIAKKQAAEEGRSVSSVVSDALRRFLDAPKLPLERRPFVMPTFSGSGRDAIDSEPHDFRILEEAEELDRF